LGTEPLIFADPVSLVPQCLFCRETLLASDRVEWPLHLSKRVARVEEWNRGRLGGPEGGYPNGFWGKVHAVPCAHVQEIERVTQRAIEDDWTFPRRAVNVLEEVVASLKERAVARADERPRLS
jgi:hypothetical protein